jgi:ATP-binding cassette subfamily C protein LapB
MIYGGMVIEIEAELKIGTEDDNQKGRFGHWFFGPLLASKFVYFQVMMAALLTNIFALATSGFSMIVYDRVMPNGAMETLVALLVGVFIIFISDFVIRSLRSYFLDVAGAQADMVIADTLFEQVIDMELAARTSPTGSVANSLREFESLRDFLTSATLTTLIDLPFAVLFLFVIWTIGGPLVYVPLAAIPLIIGSTLLIQPSLRKLTQSNYEDGQTKNSVAIETLQGIETIKAIGAGSMMRKRWQDVISHQSTIGLKTRVLSQFSSNMSNFANQLVWVGTVTLGVYLTQTGAIGSGAIVACSMLAGRSIAPLAQLSQLLTRLNTALASYRNLDALMSQPREHKNKAAYLNRPVWQGSIEFRDVSFNYPGQSQGGLQNISFKIEAGEKVAIVGKVGSGKTTLAKLLVGLYKPSSGAILVDGIDIRQIDPADLRRNIGVVMQESWLFSGTVKQNIAVGGNNPTDEEILQAAMVSGVHEFISEHPDGYAYKLKEKGEGLSGGQRQTINIARALVGRPPILLMDEPTSAMDLGHESELIAKLKNQLINQTILIITHRTSILELATRVLVLDQGKIVAQGPKSDFMRNQPPQQAGQEAAAAY